MKLGIYNEPFGGSVGGSEFSAAVLAEALKNEHEIDILHHRSSLTADQLSNIFAVDLDAVRLRYLPYDGNNFTDEHNPLRRYSDVRRWHAVLSKPYDVFINFTHNLPPFCHAGVGMLVVLFPIFNRLNAWPWTDELNSGRPKLRTRLRRTYYDWEWKQRVESYQFKAANSYFTKKWTQQRWGLNCPVLYPPVDRQFTPIDKDDIILSVGRFARTGVDKHQMEMVTTFEQMVKKGLSGWQFICVGGLGELPSDKEYFEKVRRSSTSTNSRIVANIERVELRRLYERAKIFWHAAGYNDDENLHPERQEHFGIATVEAMAAGCVPVIINRGGQREIVEHGRSGFLWDSLEELADYTVRLLNDEKLRARMSTEARARSECFGRKKFIDGFKRLLQSYLT